MNKITVETQKTANPTEGGEPIVTIANLKIDLYTEFQKGPITPFLEHPNENSEFSERVLLLFACDYVFFALDCIDNVRSRVQKEDANAIINAKAPGFAKYLKSRIFWAFSIWINITLGVLTPPKLYYSE